MGINLAQIHQDVEVDDAREEMDFLDRVWGECFEQAHLLSLDPVDVVAMELREFHRFHILHYLELVLEESVEADFDLVSSRHVSSIRLLQRDRIPFDHLENAPRPFCLHLGLD